MIRWDRPVQIFLGPGGVGKTTMAATAGVAAARAGERVVVLTIDPAHRLADALGLVRTTGHGLGTHEVLGNEPRLVAGPWPGQLWAAMLDPAETLTALIRRHGGPEQAQRVIDNRLFLTISRSLSGVNEHMAAERLRELHADPRFDRVVIDTPPSRHAVDFLDSPGRLTNFIDNRFYKAVLAPRHGLARSVNAAAGLVVRMAARMVGAELVDEVVRLFADLEGLDEGFRQRAAETAALLDGPDCSYLLVTTARHSPIQEATWIRDNLTRRSKQVDTVMVNRLTPYGRDPSVQPVGGHKVDRIALATNLDQLRSLAEREERLVAELTETGLGGGAGSVVRVFERERSLRAIGDLVAIASELRPLVASLD